MITSATTEKKRTKEKLLDLSVPQVAAGALAAVTAAILGSNLGVAGTISGAAAASVITSVSSSLYQRWLERGGQKVRTAIPTLTKPLSQPGDGAPTRPFGAPLPPAGPQQRMTDPDPGATQLTSVAGEPEGPVPPSRKHGRVRWLAAGLGAAAVFAIAMFLVTGFEAIAGQPLGGGSERGTSVGQLLGGPVQAQPDAPQHTEAPTTTAPETESTGVPEDTSDSDGSGSEETEPTGSNDAGQQDQPTRGPRDGPLPGGLIG